MKLDVPAIPFNLTLGKKKVFGPIHKGKVGK